MACILLFREAMGTQDNPVKNALEMLHRDRATWQLRAEIDPPSISRLVSDIAVQMGLPRDVALRVVESELEVRPLPPAGVCRERATRVEMPPVR